MSSSSLTPKYHQTLSLLPIEVVPCGVCMGAGKTKYRAGADKERTCESCYGSGKEKISPELSGRMYAEIAQYVLPKRKAIEPLSYINHVVSTRAVRWLKTVPLQHWRTLPGHRVVAHWPRELFRC